ncbi:SusD/RagB family nutrient-binding outer membrane lipoprotein [Olivibacter sp. SDN3]|uniref:SusD/RagB family nutrient-binding outer membrane lipoprotein n=1 Tax=Olivibacter sp. SDN3 TaxID=2764720 RepID=UPI0016517C00|nr:SusD/RagB family nutrient-binding outer membrane lipoprotein [Olivibacter sp. SDN3]QNL48668.1 SusD/RagB family nutrient-binding outer membrane lipoprotein [Olivibacter sp. SDN3]
MKKIYRCFLAVIVLCTYSACDRDFEEININPSLANELDPSYLFSNAQRLSAIATYHYQGEIVQQINTPYGGLLAAGNRNIINDQHAAEAFNTLYTGPIRYLVEVMDKTAGIPEQNNLYQMARIWKAYCFQLLVDTYGDVPYSEAGLGFMQADYLPKYDPAADIYEAIIREYTEATDALDPNQAGIGAADLFYEGTVDRWKRLGNSLLLRIAMRFTKLDETKAQTLVSIAVDPARGGVMQSNDDNAYIQFNDTYTNSTSNPLLGGERANYYVSAPFVDFLKNNNDPRLRYIAVKYEIPANPLATAGAANINPEDQQGMPYGYDESSIERAPDYPGKIGAAWRYSQFNRATVMRVNAPEFMVTFSQTQLLLAEAIVRGYLSIGNAQSYYESGIEAHMEQTPLYGNTVNISAEEKQAYLQEAEIAFSQEQALQQINTQYWVSSFRNWSEAWANFRRTGYPELRPVNFPSQDPSVPAAGGFIRRLVYPLREVSVNATHVQEAIGRMGGNSLGTRLFWDSPE